MEILKKKDILLIIGVFLIAFLVRFIGTSYGLPQEYVGDEFVQVAIGLKMLDAKSLVPNFPTIFYHQPLSAYISTFGIGTFLAAKLLTRQFSIAELKNYYSIHSTDLLLVTRFLGALLGALSIIFIYKAGKEIFNKKIALLAALFSAFEFLSVYAGHTGRVWSYMPFFIALTLFFAAKFFNQKNRKTFALAIAGTLLAAANTLPGIFTFVPNLFNKEFWKSKYLKWSFLFLGLGVLFIIALSPRGLGALLFKFQNLSGSPIVQKITGTNIHFETPHTPLLKKIIEPIQTIFNYSPLLLILSVIGFFFLFKDDRKKFWFLISFPIAYYIFIGPFFAYGWVARTLVPFSPYLALASAYGINSLAKKSRRPQIALCIMSALIILPSITGAVLLDRQLLRDDTRTEAINWIYKNIPENSKIAMFSLTDDVINPNRAVLETIKNILPSKLNTRQKTLLEADDNQFARPWYFVWDVRNLGPAVVPQNFFKDQNFTYYLRTDWGGRPQSFYDNAIEKELGAKKLLIRFDPYKEQKRNNREFGSLHNLINPWPPLLGATAFGPIVEIYKLEN